MKRPNQAMKGATTYRRVTQRKPRFNKTLEKYGKYLLNTAEEIHRGSATLDTSVRGTISEGLAYIVQAGNDCVASNLDLTTEQWMSFIDNATADWFRTRGYAEWFCIGAACQFRKSRPRILSEMTVKVRRVKVPKKKEEAYSGKQDRLTTSRAG